MKIDIKRETKLIDPLFRLRKLLYDLGIGISPGVSIIGAQAYIMRVLYDKKTTKPKDT